MCIQTPGSFVWSGSLAKRLGLTGWSTWGIFLVTGILQGTVLTMCLSFEIRDWKKRNELRASDSGSNEVIRDEPQNGVSDEHTERTSLLQNEQ